jgi:hypothetical protein
MMAPEESLRRHERRWLALIVLAFLALGTFFALYLTFSDGEWSFLVFGRMVIRGEIHLFQEGMTGRRLPLPAYVMGLSQIVGPNPLAGRLWSLALGAVALCLTFAVGRALAGSAGAILATLFLATHPVVVGFYASASYYSLSAVMILAGTWAIVARPSAQGRLLGLACFSLLSISRAHLVPMVLFVLVYTLVQARGARERTLLVAIAALPPVAFILWNPDHVKVLAYVPGLSRLVEPLGFRSLLDLGAEGMLGEPGTWEGIVWFLRRHFFWVVATGGLAAATAVGLARGSIRRPPLSAPIVFVAGLAVYTLACQVAMIPSYIKVVAAWSTTFAPLWAAVMGWAGAGLLARGSAPAWVRAPVAVLLLGVFALSPSLARHAAMPYPLPPKTTLRMIDEDAARIRAVAPKGARVFLLGSPVPAYVADVRPYLQQILGVWTLVPSTDEYAVSRSGVWGPRQIDEWLSRDAPFALVETGRLDSLEKIPSYRPVIGQIRSLLDRHFDRVGRGGEQPWTPGFDIFARRTTARERQAPR